jgi:23S rRNA (uridine2552-2'-O)-methyltransferase
VDLKEMPDLGGLDQVVAFAGDIYNEGTIGRVESHAPFDLVMSDAAPNTSGNRSLDTARSAALVEHVVALADRMLKPGGNFVAKIFQGGEEQALLDQLRQLYRTARLIKPKASRSESFETFLVGLGFGGGGQ